MTTNSSTKEKKVVSFSTVDIRHYPIIPGINPSVPGGVPLTISWEQIDAQHRTINDHEEERGPLRRFGPSLLKIPPSKRTEILRRLGHSRLDIQTATKEATVLRNRRKRTLETLHLAPLEESFDRMKRAILNVTVRKSDKAQEREFLGRYLKKRGNSGENGDYDGSSRSESTLDLSSSTHATVSAVKALHSHHQCAKTRASKSKPKTITTHQNGRKTSFLRRIK